VRADPGALRHAIVTGLILVIFLGLGTAIAKADIVKLQSTQSCNVIGLDSSPATAVGGVHCAAGNTAFSLTGILNGTLPLYIGDSSTPSWNVKNDTGAALTSLTLYYSGSLASNAFVDMQLSGTSIFAACTSTTANNVVNTSANCGTGDITPNNPALAVKLVWSGGTGVASNGYFNIGTASFAHAGLDNGCLSGTSTCTPTPEPASLVLLGSGLLAAGAGLRRKMFRS
jgi:PEP-CTERM motif